MELQTTSLSVLDTLTKHVSIREFVDKPIPEEILVLLLDKARRAPTSSNMQAYSFVVVRDRNRLKKIAELAGNQRFIETCGAFVAICADVHRLEKAASLHEKQLAKNLENFLVASVDAALVGMSLSLLAESMGLGTTMIGGMRNFPKATAEFLGLPKGVYVVFGMVLGWPDIPRTKPPKPRLPFDAAVHFERYDDSNYEEQIRQYDKVLAEYYRKQGRTTPEAAWSGILAVRFSTPRRVNLRTELEQLGFCFD